MSINFKVWISVEHFYIRDSTPFFSHVMSFTV